METQETITWYQQVPFITVLLMAVFGLSSGGFTAYFGRISGTKKSKLVEAIVLAFWSAIIPLLFGQAALSPFFGVTGLVLALYLSDGYVKYVYMFIGGAVGLLCGVFASTIGEVIDAIVPFVEIPELIHFIIIFVFTLFGIASAKLFKEYMTIIATSYAGASLFAFGVIALTFLIQDKSLLFIQNMLVSALIPFIGGFFEEVELYESALYMIGFLLTGVTGFYYQRSILIKELSIEPTENNANK